MADTDGADPRIDHELRNGADHKPSWVDGLPHNFDGWGPKTPDADALGEASRGESDLTWSGDVDDRHHYVWNFQRARRH